MMNKKYLQVSHLKTIFAKFKGIAWLIHGPFGRKLPKMQAYGLYKS